MKKGQVKINWPKKHSGSPGLPWWRRLLHSRQPVCIIFR